MVKSLPAVWETQVQSLGREDTLERENGNPLQYSSWKIPWMEEPGSYSPWGCKELVMTERLHFITLDNKNSNYKVMGEKKRYC